MPRIIPAGGRRVPRRKYVPKTYRKPASSTYRRPAPARRRPAYAPKKSGWVKDLVRGGIGIAKMLPVVGPFASAFGAMTGLGDYKIKYNSVMAQERPEAMATDYVPTVENTGGHRTVRVRHREYLQDVDSNINFTNLQFQINPSNAQCFPWLSSLAQNFQEYCFHGLVFHFVSSSGDALNSTNTALGMVIMGVDYNAGNVAFANKIAAENSEYTISSKPSCSAIMGVECAPSMTINNGHLYVSPLQNGQVPAGQDIKTYNLGNFQFMTQGSQAIADIGELWVSYDIELLKPTVPVLGLLGGRADHFRLSAVTTGNPIGTSQTTRINSLGCSISSAGAFLVITFPADVEPSQPFMIQYLVQGTASTGAIVGAGFTSPSSLVTTISGAWANNGTSVDNTGTSDTVCSNNYIVQIVSTYVNDGTSPNCELITSSSNFPAAAGADLIITALPLGYS